MVTKCVKILAWLWRPTFWRQGSPWCVLFGIIPESCVPLPNLLYSFSVSQRLCSLFQMLLRSATRVTRSLSGTSCTSGVPWHPLVASSSFWCPPPSSFICVRSGNHPAGDNSNNWQFLVQYRSKTTWSKNSLISPCHVSPLQTPLPSPQLALNSSFSSKPSKEDSPKPGIIARWHCSCVFIW